MKPKIELFMVCLWIVWHDRNKMVIEEVDIELRQTAGIHSFEWVESYLEDSHRGITESAKIGGGVISAIVQARWKVPQEGLWKVNSDAAVREYSSEWLVGAVIQDRQGRFLAAFR